jgi:hypothetical protein
MLGGRIDHRDHRALMIRDEIFETVWLSFPSEASVFSVVKIT